jgi:hypothetical protein
MEGGTQTAVRPGNEAHWPLSVQAPPGRTVPGKGAASGPGAEASSRLAAASDGGGSLPPSAGVPAASCRRVTGASAPATPASVVRKIEASANPPVTPASLGRKIGASASPPVAPASLGRETGASGLPGRTVPASRPGLGVIAASPGTACGPASAAAPLSRSPLLGAASHLDPSAARAASPPDCAPPPAGG